MRDLLIKLHRFNDGGDEINELVPGPYLVMYRNVYMLYIILFKLLKTLEAITIIILTLDEGTGTSQSQI